MPDAPLSIVLAEDDADDQYFFQSTLQQIPISTTLTTVPNGEQLMAHLLHTGHLPAVIFLDINMPRKNGIRCLEEIKNNDRLKHIPVVIYSTAVGDDIVDSLYLSGAYFYMRKTSLIDLRHLLARILLTILLDPGNQPPRPLFRINIPDRRFRW